MSRETFRWLAVCNRWLRLNKESESDDGRKRLGGRDGEKVSGEPSATRSETSPSDWGLMTTCWWVKVAPTEESPLRIVDGSMVRTVPVVDGSLVRTVDGPGLLWSSARGEPKTCSLVLVIFRAATEASESVLLLELEDEVVRRICDCFWLPRRWTLMLLANPGG